MQFSVSEVLGVEKWRDSAQRPSFMILPCKLAHQVQKYMLTSDKASDGNLELHHTL